MRFGLADEAEALRPRPSSPPAVAGAAGICGRLADDTGGEGGRGLPPNPPTENRRNKPSPSLAEPDDGTAAPALVTRPRGVPIWVGAPLMLALRPSGAEPDSGPTDGGGGLVEPDLPDNGQPQRAPP